MLLGKATEMQIFQTKKLCTVKLSCNDLHYECIKWCKGLYGPFPQKMALKVIFSAFSVI